jgi:cytosine/adenosine deaminase-related metal-dependent hydrolase
MSPAKGRRRASRGSRPRKKTTLIRGGWVVTADAAGRAGRLDLRIENGRIVEIGKKLGARGAGRVIDAKRMIVMPGLVQAHVHLCQSLFRGQAEDLDLLSWLRDRIWPLEGALEERETRAAVRLGLAELLTGGTTTILDMGSVRYGDVQFQEAERFGIRYTGGKAMMDQGQGLPAGLRETTEEAVTESVRLCDEWHGAAQGRLRYAFSPRFALSCSQEAMRRSVVAARERGALLHTHAAESADEVGLVRDRTGMGNVEYLHSLGFSGRDVLLAHGIWLSTNERRILRETGTRIVHCPSANLKLGSGIARVRELLDDEILVALGADGAACNNTLDGFFEMRLAALLHRARGGPRALPAQTALRMATRYGAEALGLSDVGSIEVGHLADLVFLDTHKPHLAPGLGDLHARVVFTASAADVHSVLVAGEPVVEEGELLTAEVVKIAKAADKAAKRVAERAG